jgi:MFS family permease
MAQHLIPQWSLSAGQAGLMASSFAAGYMLAVPVLTALTDRMDARLVLLTGSAVSGLATFSFGLLADGLLSASLIWTIAGIGFSGAYMPRAQGLGRSPSQWRLFSQRHALHSHILRSALGSRSWLRR